MPTASFATANQGDPPRALYARLLGSSWLQVGDTRWALNRMTAHFALAGGPLIGDLIVGVEGQRVENFEQYRAVNAFFEQDDMKLTVWRGDRLLPITVTAPNRTIGVELRSYPVEGYTEKVAGSTFCKDSKLGRGPPDPSLKQMRFLADAGISPKAVDFLNGLATKPSTSTPRA